eukprot:gene30374-35380_t
MPRWEVVWGNERTSPKDCGRNEGRGGRLDPQSCPASLGQGFLVLTPKAAVLLRGSRSWGSWSWSLCRGGVQPKCSAQGLVLYERRREHSLIAKALIPAPGPGAGAGAGVCALWMQEGVIPNRQGSDEYCTL